MITLGIAGCGKNNTQNSETNDLKETEPTGMVVKDQEEERSDVINNVLVGNTKISFNNKSYDQLSNGNFTQETLWGAFQKKDNRDTYIQINAADKEQPIYGEINGYELEGVNWDQAEQVQYLGVQEEAIQSSKDNKAMMYKAKTGDIIFSVAMFGKKELTDEEILELKGLAKDIKIEYIDQAIGGEEW
ncbi:hypothetical protein [Vagococcus jeotgali]|uniref:hypothetical protein n=1 Tax=Vagococcus jeotgali TaxID=3109030 RepID=UPI002DD824BB|nr:hypothetical protein [Vagococcus sp. B2T-5]